MGIVLLALAATGATAVAEIPFDPLETLPDDAPFVLPPGYRQELVAYRNDPVHTLSSRGSWDMVALNIDGTDDAGRFLFRSHETGSNAGVSRTDFSTGLTEVIVADPDFGAFDPAFWTPWNTLLTAEEWSGEGRLYEITNPLAPVGSVNIVRRTAIPLVSHEGLALDRAGNLYFVDESNTGGIYKFVPTNPLSSDALVAGQSFVLRDLNSADGKNVGVAQWVPITDVDGNPFPPEFGITNPFDNSEINRPGRRAADDVGATNYGRPEDLEIGTLANGREVLYAAVTSTHQVFSIELDVDAAHDTQVRVFADRGTTNVATGSSVGGDFSFPDNLATDSDGNVYIVEDNEPGDVWFVEDTDHDGVAERVALWATLTTPGSEPTGLFFDPLNPDISYIDVQHPATGLGDATFRIIAPPMGDMNFDSDVDFDDIGAFALGLVDPAGYRQAFGVEATANGDTNDDGRFDFDDITGFVALLTGQGQAGSILAVPEPPTFALAMLVACAAVLAVARHPPRP